MGSKESQDALLKLALSIGDFIRYWGFRRIHGAIWAQLYLSPTPLSCTELAEKLGFSKALISPALGELEEYKLIHQVKPTDAKTLRYEAEPDVNSVIQHVLKIREARMLAQISTNLSRLQKLKNDPQMIRPDRLEQVGTMVDGAQIMMKLMLNEEDVLNLHHKFGGDQ